MKRGLLRAFAIGTLFLLLFLPAKKEVSLNRAQAASLNAYPTVCLGGWQNPGNAAGEPDGNPAVLNQTAAQIFCGYFKSNDQSESPTKVILSFAWNIVANAPPAAISVDADSQAWNAVINSSTASSTTDASPPVFGDQTSSSSDSTSSAPADASGVAAAVSSTSDTSTTSDVSAVLLIEASSTASDLTTSTATSSTPDAGTPDATTTATTTSFLDGVGNFIAGIFLNRAAAQTPPAPGFLEASYSLDGQNWQTLGEVSRDNWQDLTFNIPVSSWTDIDNIQIQLNPLPTVDMPTVQLDGMWLQVDYDQSIVDTLKSGANAALDAAANLTDAVSGVISNVADAVTNALNGQPEIATGTQDQAIQPTLSVPPAHRYSFTLDSIQNILSGPMPWASERNIQTDRITNDALPAVTLVGQNVIQIEGTCMNAYYTILVFTHPNDYITDPSSAIFNKAFRCENGEFSRTISDNDLPSELKSAAYYLIVGDQGTRGSWQPRPGMFQISFTASQ